MGPGRTWWTVLVAVKGLPEAKSRLMPASPDPLAHGALVEAIRADTVAAASRAEGVARVVLVADRAGVGLAGVADALVVVQHSPGLNGALRDGAELAASRWPGDGVAALVGDLPALRPDELGAALAAAGAHEHAFVADASGTGTTLLTARPGRTLRPEFGTGSAGRHRLHATPLGAGAGLRLDVDTAEDLTGAAMVGLGPATAAVVGTGSRPPCSPAGSSSATGIVTP